MKNFAWINLENSLVENVICYDGVTPITLPDNVLLVEIPEGGVYGTWSMAGIGWSYINNQFVEPAQPEQLTNNQPTTTGSQTL
jgi:hypothetical protein